MARRIGRWLLWLLVLGAAGGGLAYWLLREPSRPAIAYRTGTVGHGDIVQTITASGQLYPMTNVSVGSQVSGIIQRIYVDFNSRVTNGQLIAEIDPATYQQRLIQADGEYANAEAQLALAQVNARRAAELLRNQLITQADHDQSVAELQQRQAMLRIREAARVGAQVDFDRTKITAPIDGVVISRNIDVGQTVQASFQAPTLFQIANDLRQMQIQAMVSEADVGNVEVGQEATFLVEAFMNRVFSGRVSQVRNAATTNQNVVSYATIIDVANDDLRLKPSMTATVTITTGKKENVLRVPSAALRFRPPEGATVRTNTLALAKGSGGSPPAPDNATMSSGPRGSGGRDGDPAPDRRQRGPGMRGEFGGRGGPGGFGEGGGRSGGMRGGGSGGQMTAGGSFSSSLATVYLVQSNSPTAIELIPTSVRLGIGDSASSEVLDGLKDGDVVALNTITPTTSSAPRPAGNPISGMRRPF